MARIPRIFRIIEFGLLSRRIVPGGCESQVRRFGNLRIPGTANREVLSPSPAGADIAEERHVGTPSALWPGVAVEACAEHSVSGTVARGLASELELLAGFRENGSEAALDALRQALTPPRLRPPCQYRCRNRNASITGRTATTEPVMTIA